MRLFGGSDRLKSGLLAAGAAALGAILVVHAGRAFVGHFLAIPGTPVVEALQRLQTPGREQLELLVATRRDALDWHDYAQGWSELGLAYAALAQGSTGPERSDLLSRSREALERGLRQAPANPYSWMQLAHVLLHQRSPSHEAVAMLAASLATGPNEPRLVFPGLDAGLTLWHLLDEAQRMQIRGLARRAWSLAPVALAASLSEHGRTDLLRATTLNQEPLGDERLFAGLQAGLSLWGFLNSEDRAAVLALLRRGWVLNPLATAELVETNYRMDVLTSTPVLGEPTGDKQLFEALEGVARLWRHLRAEDRQAGIEIFRRAWGVDPGRTANLAGQYGLIELLASSLQAPATGVLPGVTGGPVD